MAITLRILGIPAFQEETRFLIALLVEVMQQLRRGLRRQLARQIIQPRKNGQEIRFGVCRRHRLHSLVQLDQRLQDALFRCVHESLITPSSPLLKSKFNRELPPVLPHGNRMYYMN